MLARKFPVPWSVSTGVGQGLEACSAKSTVSITDTQKAGTGGCL